MNKNWIFWFLSTFLLQACESYTANTQKPNSTSIPKKPNDNISPTQNNNTPSTAKEETSVNKDAPTEAADTEAPKPFKPLDFESKVTIQIGGQDRTFMVEVPNEDNIAFQKDVHNFFVDLLAYQNDSAKAAANHTSDKKTSPEKMKELAAQEDKWKKEMAAAELKSEQELLKLFDTFWRNLSVGGVPSNQFIILPTEPNGAIQIKKDIGGISATAENDPSGTYQLINKTNLSPPTSPTIAQALKDAIDNLLMGLIQAKQKEIMTPPPSSKLLSADMTDTASTIRMRHAETGHIDLRQSFGGILNYKAPVFIKIAGDDNFQKSSGTSSSAMYKLNNILVGMTQTWKTDTKKQLETSIVSTFVFDKAFIEFQQGMISINETESGTRHLTTLGYDINRCFTPFIQFGKRQLEKNSLLQKESRAYVGATLDMYNEKNNFMKYNTLISVKGGMNTTHVDQHSLTTFEMHLKAQTDITSHDGVTFSTGAELSNTLDSKLNLSIGFTH